MSITWDKRGDLILSQISLQELHRLLGPAIQSYEIGMCGYCTGNQCGGEHQDPCGVERTLIALSASLRQSFQGATRWSIADTTAGLLKLYKRHSVDGATDTINKCIEVKNRFELEEMLEWIRWSVAAYDEKDKLALATKLKVKEQDVVKVITKSAINKPAFFIALHHARKCVVMGIRGTQETSDILTDLNPHNEPFLQGAAHSGMLGAAKWLFNNEGHTLKSLLAQHWGYKLILTGHSLGAATAALLTMLIRATETGWFLPTTSLGIRSSKIFCWGFGCAPCVDRTLAESSNYICNVVLQDDVVPRVSPAAIEALRKEIQETAWSHGIKGETAKKVVEKIEKVSVSNILNSGSKAGASVFQKFQEIRTTYGASSSGTAATNELLDTMDKTMTEQDGHKTEGGIETAQALAAVAMGSSTNTQELERRRVFVPGVLYHIKRQVIKKEEQAPVVTVPAKPYQAGVDAPRNAGFKHVVVRGTDPASRFGRIILSGTMLSDHSCYKYIEGLLDAMQHLPKMSCNTC